MRIAVLAQDFPPRRGGTHVYNAELAARLARRGHEVRVLTWHTSRDAAFDATFPFELFRRPNARGRRGLAEDGVRELLAEWRSQVALVSGSCAAVRGVAHAAARAVPVVLAVHDLRDKGRSYGRNHRWRLRRRYGWQRAARLAANSRDTCDRLLRLGVAPERIRVVHPGVDTGHFVPDAAAGGALREREGLSQRPLLLSVSRLAGNKGHTRILRALPPLRREFPELVYAIVGTGPERARLEALCAELDLGASVRFVGNVADVRSWYQACDVFAMPSTPTARGRKAAEGFGISYLEAAACGAPAIASSSGGGPEIVLDGSTGRVVDPDDDEGLLAALRELLKDRERARQMGVRAREHVLRFDWERGADALEQVLHEVVTSG